ncbi:MAG: malto-oligosyltrehalose synthase [Plectolyngbya sp. WJT66-NPBG17]|jgi:(1->4)-alpha-D-glucan 1-alpha-D-glucosylmutase|nr:malto-oligosyltrehalose synthase [Plectolyngbya sp. WJT66-NPBG17]MBW4525183.1 malto-oligosyltrehalose synthase [Phormidium tanganyikae FI6-MK23]
MRIPLVTYRIQLHQGFQFEDATKIVGYLAKLGISDFYASPIFKAKAGSTHGYDVVDPTQLNPELGTPEIFEQLVDKLQHHNMGWVQDIVPNHMSYDRDNRYLMDVLENGFDSDYSQYFDLAWNSPFRSSRDPILAPLLGDFYGSCLENGDIQLQYNQDGLTVNYYNFRAPLRLESYSIFLTHDLGKLARALGRRHPDFVKLLAVLYMLKSLPTVSGGKQRQDEAEFVKGLLWELHEGNPEVKSFIGTNIQFFNGEAGNPQSVDWLDKILSEQFFRLSYWKVGAEEINYRRFFTVNELISVKVEELKVFNNTHELIARLVKEGKVTGLRIDHIDGLSNPKQYLERLQEKVGDAYIVAEKILQPGEDVPKDWSIQGTSGYDYLNYLNSVFCDVENESRFDQIYQQIQGRSIPFEEVVLDKKHLILDKNLAGDLDNLARLLKDISLKDRYGNDFTINGLKRAIAEVLTQFSIYRTYTTEAGVSECDRNYIQTAIETARENAPFSQKELDFIEKLLLLEYDNSLTPADKEQWLYFAMRIQQYTGPLMAKGVEDTAFFVYNRLISLNEVGGDPGRFGISTTEFHQFNQYRQQNWNAAMNASSTHDTKRGEDTRARINVLSEIPDEWQAQLQKWREINQKHKVQNKKALMPSANDEYAFYQTLIGAYPFQESELEGFVDRVEQYAIKSIREAKVSTAWLRPNAPYEDACTKFVKAILEDNQFLTEFLPFQKKITQYGVFNSLSQTLIKITSPGIPDFYQGTELWDLSLVDPDNRRPVDFAQREAFLDAIQAAEVSELMPKLLEKPQDGKIKLFLTAQALKVRNQYKSVFLNGEYISLEATGKFKDHIIAFARKDAEKMVVTIAPRLFTRLIQPEQLPIGEIWEDTAIELPASNWKNAIANTEHSGTTIVLQDVLKHFPVALLTH